MILPGSEGDAVGTAPDRGTPPRGDTVASVVAGARIVPMEISDVPAVVALEAQLFAADSPWTAAMFLGELRAGWPYWVARAEPSGRAGPGDSGNELLGYAGLAIGPDDADVQTIGVHPAARGLGLGRALLRTLLAAAGDRVVHLEVRTDNDIAIALYVSEGFERIGLRRRYYRPSGADAYTMIRRR